MSQDKEREAPSSIEARYRFLLGFMIEKGILTNKRYGNGTWVLRGVYGIDDSGLNGAGRTAEEALDNAIIAHQLDEAAAERFRQATHAALIAEKQAQVVEIERLHTAICQAVAIINVSVEMASMHDGRKVSEILRQALSAHADAALTEKEQP